MTTPNKQHRDFGPDYFNGWPATVPAERLERAIQYTQDRVKAQPSLLIKGDLPSSGDDAFDMDMFLTAHSMLSSYQENMVDLSPLDAASDEDFLLVLGQILIELETEHHFTCAIISNLHSSQGTITIFTLAKHPDWMGLSISLPNLRDLHVIAVESGRTPGDPAAMFAVPGVMMPDRPMESPPLQENNIKVLAQVAAWHGAASFNWLPTSSLN